MMKINAVRNADENPTLFNVFAGRENQLIEKFQFSCEAR